MKFELFIWMYILFVVYTNADAETCGNLEKKVQLLEAKLNKLFLQSEQHERDLKIKEKRIETLENVIRSNFKPLSETEDDLQAIIDEGDTTETDYNSNSSLSSINQLPDVNPVVNGIKRRGIVSSGYTGEVAFYAYMSSSEQAPSTHHTLIFDVPRANIGNAYNKYSGLFIAPSSGVYHFSWTVYSLCHGYIYTEIMKNSEIYGAALASSEEVCDAHISTSNAIIEMNQGDVVFIRTSSRFSNKGDINSFDNSRSSFSGFKIK